MWFPEINDLLADDSVTITTEGFVIQVDAIEELYFTTQTWRITSTFPDGSVDSNSFVTIYFLEGERNEPPILVADPNPGDTIPCLDSAEASSWVYTFA